MKNKKRFLTILMVMIMSVLAVLPVSAATTDAITPNGNLTLVDDFSGTTTSGKQFVTLVTKNGNYFYLIIDRDDSGQETVHFLNQVDETDLLALMEDEEIESLGLNKEPVVESVLEEPEKIVTDEPVEEVEPKVSSGMIVVVAFLAVGILIVVYAKMKDMKKKKSKAQKHEPEEEEYYEFMDLEQEMNGEGLDEE